MKFRSFIRFFLGLVVVAAAGVAFASNGNREADCSAAVQEYINPQARSDADGAIVLFHGFAHGGEYFTPQRDELLARGADMPSIRSVWVAELPNHGANQSCKPLTYMKGRLAGYELVVDAVLRKIAATGVKLRVLVGHSMGGYLLVREQQTLHERGTSMQRVFGTTAVVLQNPMPINEARWPIAENTGSVLPRGVACLTGPIIGKLIPFIHPPYIKGSAEATRSTFFQAANGKMPSVIPNLMEVAKYNSKEPIGVGLDLIGALNRCSRGHAAAGIFGPSMGTKLVTWHAEDDLYIELETAAKQHSHLISGSAELKNGFIRFVDPSGQHLAGHNSNWVFAKEAAEVIIQAAQ